ncbi:O-antigen ligase family protein [Psychrobacillus vulpis]|uniref:O-antigen ligase family protein n=1 Tax=Psychrobacillus vulpis TaxID=2325572 RepID=UPI00140C33BC|nr:O-antigen ligase family protein [Psychrobacillus vulpis]
MDLRKSELRGLINRQSLICLLLMVTILVQIINGIEGEITINDAIKFALFPLSFLYCCILAPNFLLKNNYENTFLKFLIYPGIFLSLITLITSFITALSYGGIDLTTLQTAQFNIVHGLFDSNYQGAVVAVSSVVCIYLLFKNKGNKLYYSLILMVNILNLIVLASRASLLSLALCIIIAIIVYGSRKIKFLLLSGVAICGILYCYYNNSIKLSPIFYYNIFDAERGSTGRIDIWKEILQKSTQKVFTGNGNNTLEITSLDLHNNLSSSHNSFIDFFAINGGIVLILYLIVLLIGVFKSFNHAKESAVFLVFICIFVLMNFTTHNLGGVSYVPQILGILLGIIFIHVKKKSK